MNRAKGCRGARTSKAAGGFATPVLRRPSHTKDFVNRAVAPSTLPQRLWKIPGCVNNAQNLKRFFDWVVHDEINLMRLYQPKPNR